MKWSRFLYLACLWLTASTPLPTPSRCLFLVRLLYRGLTLSPAPEENIITWPWPFVQKLSYFGSHVPCADTSLKTVQMLRNPLLGTGFRGTSLGGSEKNRGISRQNDEIPRKIPDITREYRGNFWHPIGSIGVISVRYRLPRCIVLVSSYIGLYLVYSVCL